MWSTAIGWGVVLLFVGLALAAGGATAAVVSRSVENSRQKRRQKVFAEVERAIGFQLEREAHWFRGSPPAMLAIRAVAKEMSGGPFSMEDAHKQWKKAMADRFPPPTRKRPFEDT